MSIVYYFIYGAIAFISACVVWGIAYRRVSGVCTSTNKLHGNTVIITGASAGIGKSTAYDLARRGARVILACRNKQKAEVVKQNIVSSTGNSNVVVKIVNVADLESVRKFCKNIIDTEPRLDILINNAGVGLPKREESPQGHELTIATNHYGHFLMTSMLLGLLKKSGSSRIINVSSLAHKSFYLDLDDLHYKKRSYNVYKAYAQSKLCNILFTKHLAHLLLGTGVTVNALHPGVVTTEISAKDGSFLGKLITVCSKLIGKDADLGAQTTIYLAVADEVKNITGEYFVDCQVSSTSKKALDPAMAKTLWDITEEETQIQPDEKNY